MNIDQMFYKSGGAAVGEVRRFSICFHVEFT